MPDLGHLLPVDISSPGLSHSTARPGTGSGSPPGGPAGSSSSVPDTCNFASSFGQPSSGTGGKTRTSAVPRSP